MVTTSNRTGAGARIDTFTLTGIGLHGLLRTGRRFQGGNASRLDLHSDRWRSNA